MASRNEQDGDIAVIDASVASAIEASPILALIDRATIPDHGDTRGNGNVGLHP
jgi:hypothetical protein